jgi:hypothetical protein
MLTLKIHCLQSYAVLDVCRSMLASLYRQQQLQQGTHQDSVAKLGDNAAFAAAWTAAVKSLEQKGVRPPAHKDPQSNTVEDVYSEEEYMRLVRHLLRGQVPGACTRPVHRHLVTDLCQQV